MFSHNEEHDRRKKRDGGIVEITAVPGHADGQKYNLTRKHKPTGNDQETETKHDRMDDQGEMLPDTASLCEMFRDAMFHREKVLDMTAKKGGEYMVTSKKESAGNDQEAETEDDEDDWEDCESEMSSDMTAVPGGKSRVTSKQKSAGSDQEAEIEDDENDWEEYESETSSDGESPCPLKALCHTMARCEMVPDIAEMPGGKYLVTWQHQSACNYQDEQDLETMEEPHTYIERYRCLLRKINAVTAMTSAKPGEKTQLLDEIRSKAKEWGVMI